MAAKGRVLGELADRIRARVGGNPPPAVAPVMASPPPIEAPALAPRSSRAILEVPVSALEPDPEQPRKGLERVAADAADYLRTAGGDIAGALELAPPLSAAARLLELAATIHRDGVQSPIRARPFKRESGALAWRIVSGERRWRAARLAKLEAVPVLEAIADGPADLLACQIVENTARDGLTAADRARATLELLDLLEGDRPALRARLGLSESAASKVLTVGAWLRGGGEPARAGAGMEALYRQAIAGKAGDDKGAAPRVRTLPAELEASARARLRALGKAELVEWALANAPAARLQALTEEAE